MTQNDWRSFASGAKARPVEGGLKARSARGSIGSTWWSRRFIDVLESLAIGGRLTRGRAYARKGQVISLDVTPGEVTASVQGSQARPYRVRIGFRAVHRTRLGQGRDRAVRAGPAERQAAGRRGAARTRDDLRRRGCAAVPTLGRRPRPALQLPRLDGAVQAPGRHVLPAGRGVRRRPVPHPALAWSRPRRAARPAARAAIGGGRSVVDGNNDHARHWASYRGRPPEPRWRWPVSPHRRLTWTGSGCRRRCRPGRRSSSPTRTCCCASCRFPVRPSAARRW